MLAFYHFVNVMKSYWFISERAYVMACAYRMILSKYMICIASAMLTE